MNFLFFIELWGGTSVLLGHLKVSSGEENILKCYLADIRLSVGSREIG